MVSPPKEIKISGAGLSGLEQTAAQLLEQAREYPVWLFDGSMGAGKTTLIKAVCRQLGVTDNVTSPTFSLVNEYRSAAGPVYHCDFYRVEDVEEALQAGVTEFFYSGHFCFIEWPAVVRPILPGKYVIITIEVGSGEDRNYNLTFYDNI